MTFSDVAALAGIFWEGSHKYLGINPEQIVDSWRNHRLKTFVQDEEDEDEERRRQKYKMAAWMDRT